MDPDQLKRHGDKRHVVDLRSDTVTRPTAEMRRAMAEADGRRRRVRRRSHRQPPGSPRRGNLWQRSGAVRAHRLHGQPDRHQGMDASRRRSDLRRAQPRKSVRAGVDVRDRRLHAAHRARAKTGSSPGSRSKRSSGPRFTTTRRRRWSAWKTPQHGRRHGVPDGAGERNLRSTRTTPA